MSGPVSWNLQLAVQGGRLDEARALMSEMVAATEQERGAIGYEWFLSPDGQVCHEFVSYIEPFEAQGGQMRWTLTDFNTESDGDVAWTRYINRAVLNMAGEESRFHWIETAILTRQPDGTWKIDRLQSTPVSIEGAMAGDG